MGRTEKRFGDLARTLFPLAGVLFVLVGYNDLGTMICMLILFLGLMFAAGVQVRVFGGMGAIALVGIGLLVLLHGYRDRAADRLPAPAAATATSSKSATRATRRWRAGTRSPTAAGSASGWARAT